MTTASTHGPEPDLTLGVLVLAGGSARRLGGVEKTAIVVAGQTLLDRAIGAWPAELPMVVVGPRGVSQRVVTWERESPPGGGPVSAIAAGVGRLNTDLVAIAAGDAPLIAPGVKAIVAAARDKVAAGGDGSVAVNPSGRRQNMPCCIRRDRLIEALPDADSGVALWRVLTSMDLTSVVLDEDVLHDVDTAEDLTRVRKMIGDPGGKHER